MPELTFEVLSAEPQPYAAVPMLAFKLRVRQGSTGSRPTQFHSIGLQCQLRIEPTRRRYSPSEQQGLFDLFGQPSQWAQSLRSMLWTHAQTTIGPFRGSVAVDLPVPCSYDFNVAATKYFYALEADDIPLSLLFSGTMFYAGKHGSLQMAQISWDREATFRLPVAVWKQMMEQYYPNSVWLPLPREVFGRLQHFKQTQGLATWDQALERLLPDNDRQAVP